MHKIAILIILSTSLIGACSNKANYGVDPNKTAKPAPKNCKLTTTNCEGAKRCYAEQYALDDTGATIVSKVTGCQE